MQSDAVLAAAAASGDRAAFETLYRRYHPGLVGFVVRQVGDHHLAEDIVQDCFLTAWRDLGKLRDPGAVKTWLFTIAYRGAANQFGRPVPMPLSEMAHIVDDGAGARPDVVAEQKEAQALVWGAALGLEPRQRAVLELSVRWELSSSEIGDVLGVGRAHAAVLVHRARSALGTAVRAMLVAGQRGRCRRLDDLVDGHRRELTPRQRSTVDHHIRRCPECRSLTARATSPALLASIFAYADGATGNAAVPAAKASAGWLGGVGAKATAAAVLMLGAAGAYAVTEQDNAPREPLSVSASSATTVPSPSPSPSPSLLPSPSVLPSLSPSRSPSPAVLSPEAQMLVLVNKRRAEAGCNPVRADARLDKAAEGHSADMAKRGYFGHETPEGVTPWDRAKAAGYSTPSAENIAAGNASAKATMEQFMNSPGHRANILNCQHKALGIGRATGGPYRYYWTQLFGSR